MHQCFKVVNVLMLCGDNLSHHHTTHAGMILLVAWEIMTEMRENGNQGNEKTRPEGMEVDKE